jgi:DNA invertase Pin-like site-specific DNA recombinase
MIIGFAIEKVWGHEPSRVAVALNEAGCERIVLAKADSHYGLLESLVRQLNTGDVFIVDTLASLADTMEGVLDRVEDFYNRGVHLRSLCERFDSQALNIHPVISVAQLRGLERKFQ